MQPSITVPMTTNKQLEKMPEGFSAQRSDKYALATQEVPSARLAELNQVQEVLSSLGVKSLNRIVEIGSGQGFGTAQLLKCLTPDGTLYGVDASSYMTQKIQSHPNLQLHIGALDQLALESESIDFVFSLAAFHHVPNKFLVVQEIRRILRPNAYFLIVDVNHDTPAQKFFDYVVRPYCSSGHDADFLDHSWAKLIAQHSNLELVSSNIRDTDWRFDNEYQMLQYICDIFCLELTPNKVKPLVEYWLKPYQVNHDSSWVMPWSLGFHVFQKSFFGIVKSI